MIKRVIFNISLSFLAASLLQAQTIAEKKAGATAPSSGLSQEMQKFLKQVNKELAEWHDELKRLYAQVYDLYRNNAPEESYRDLLIKINDIKSNILILENSWRQMASQSHTEEEYGLWHQPETTLGQLIMDYGSQNYVYLMTPEVSNYKLSVNSNLPIPGASWDEMMEAIINNNGLGIKQINPYLRQIYMIKEDNSGIKMITNKRSDLEVLPPDTRIAFMLTPEPSEIRRIWVFLEKFINPNTSVLQSVGRNILIIAPVAETLDMLKLYDFVLANRGEKEYKVIPLLRVNPEEMARILAFIFDLGETPAGGEPRPPPMSPQAIAARERGLATEAPRNFPPPPPKSGNNNEANGLKVIPLAHVAQAIFLVGTKEEIKQAEDIIYRVENQVGEAREKIVYTYVAKNSNAEELATILEKVYNMMIITGAGIQQKPLNPSQLEEQQRVLQSNQQQIMNQLALQPEPKFLAPVKEYSEGYYLDDSHIVNPEGGLEEPRNALEANRNRNNFIVDPMTGAIVMVVEADALPKLKELIKKLDVPKKMVQVEVLLFEKRLERNTDFGLNLLKLGDCASQHHSTCTTFNDVVDDAGIMGIFQFFISRKRTDSGVPAFDAAYRFLLSQNDIMINAAPSVVAINQTTARIEIEQEISVSTGTFVVPTENSPSLKNSFARARYGIVIEITPTIHINEDEYGNFDENVPNYITLDTDIKFETIAAAVINLATPGTPPVIRRKINNSVRIEDGQTVIIGGLRRKDTDDRKESIPFLGEIPGFGKLFASRTALAEIDTDMFIFMTPKIISDPGEDMERIKRIEMTRRPGDIPEFMCKLYEARQMEKERLFEGTMRVLFGMPWDRCYSPYGEHPLPEERADCQPSLYGEYDGS